MSEAQSLGLGGTIALPPGVSPRQALKLSVSDRMTELSLAPGFRERVSQRFDPPPYRSIIEAGVEDYWTPAVEDASGYHATESGKAEARSRNGDAVLVYRSVNAGMLLQHTKGHVLVRSFDPLMPGTHEQVGTPL